jgi:hypothetical protein
MRYLTCRRCGLKVKTEERLAVPWDRGDFMTLVAQVFPEDAMVDVATLNTKGLLGESLSQLNARLIRYGWQLELVKDQGRVVGVVRRRISPVAPERTSGELDKGRSQRHSRDGS